jgi:hypothetical protein
LDLSRIAAALAIAALCLTTPAKAEPLPDVEVAIVSATGGTEELGERITSWFRAQNIHVETKIRATLESEAVLAPPRAGVHVWVAILPSQARVFFAVKARDDDPPRYLVSEIPYETGLDEVTVEQIGQVIYLCATGLWEGNLESSREEVVAKLEKPSSPAPAPTPAPAPIHDTPSAPPPAAGAIPISLRLGVEYAARWRGDPGLANLVGGSLGVLQKTGAFAFGGQLRVAVLLPQTATSSGVDLVTQGATVTVGPFAERVVRRGTWLSLEAGLGVDAIRYRTGALADVSLRPADGGTDLQPFAITRAGARFELGPIVLGVDALLVAELLRAHYDLASAGGRAELIVPWRVQPGLAAGASY